MLQAGLDIERVGIRQMLNFTYATLLDSGGPWRDPLEVRKRVDGLLDRAALLAEGKEPDTGAAAFVRMLGGSIENIPVIPHKPKPEPEPEEADGGNR